MRRRSGIIEAHGACKDCDATFTHYRNAMALAAQHAQRTGHTTWCDQTISVEYNPKES